MKTAPAPAFTPRADVYDIITNRLIQALENGVTPWKKPWNAAYGAPRNYRSKHVYSGINALLLGMLDTEVPYFLTYKQAQELGGQVRRGEKGWPVVFSKTTKREEAAPGGPQGPAQGPQAGKERPGFYLQYSTVFNIAQVEGIAWELPAPATRPHTPQQGLAQVVAAYADAPRIQHQGSEAHYRSSTDTVTVPAPAHFHSGEDYAHTLLHELVHSTGHARRLSRPGLLEVAPFGSPTYALEELVAELGASFLGNAAGLDLSLTEQNSASYIESWLKALRNDKRLIVTAASQAQKAANYVLGITPGYPEQEVGAGTSE